MISPENNYLKSPEENKNGLWFKRRMFGLGWVPIRWQGWVVTLLYIIGLVSIFNEVDGRSRSASDTLISVAIPFIILTAFLIIICYKTGEKPMWQWGKRKSE